MRLFARMLRRDQEGLYWLETPFERGHILVKGAPFIIVSLRIDGAGQDQRLVFITNTDEEITMSSQYSLYFVTHPGKVIPYIRMKDGLPARIFRPVFYQLQGQLTLTRKPSGKYAARVIPSLLGKPMIWANNLRQPMYRAHS